MIEALRTFLHRCILVGCALLHQLLSARIIILRFLLVSVTTLRR